MEYIFKQVSSVIFWNFVKENNLTVEHNCMNEFYNNSEGERMAEMWHGLFDNTYSIAVRKDEGENSHTLELITNLFNKKSEKTNPFDGKKVNKLLLDEVLTWNISTNKSNGKSLYSIFNKEETK